MCTLSAFVLAVNLIPVSFGEDYPTDKLVSLALQAYHPRQAGLGYQIGGLPEITFSRSHNYHYKQSTLHMKCQFRTAKKVDRKLLTDFVWQYRGYFDRVWINCGVGELLTLEFAVPLDKITLHKLRQETQVFVRALMSIAGSFEPGDRWAKPRIDERQVIKNCTEEDLSELITFWGWTRVGGMMPSMGGEVVRFTSNSFLIHQPSGGGGGGLGPYLTVFASGITPGIGDRAPRLESDLCKRYPDLNITITPTQSSARLDIDLEKGVAIGEIKKRILRFVSITKGFIIQQ